MKILVLVAHPDDEVLGCGGTVKLFSSTHQVSICAMGEGETSRSGVLGEKVAERQRQFKQACSILGAKAITYPLMHLWPDQRFEEVGILNMSRWYETIIEDEKPRVIITHSNADLNQDHRLVNEAVQVATRPSVFKQVDLITMETHSSTEWGIRPFHPNYFVGFPIDVLNAKIQAMKVYGNEIRKPPHPRSEDYLRYMAQIRGSQCGYLYAEAYEAIRLVT